MAQSNRQERIDELAALKDGWHNGDGIAPNAVAINNARAISMMLQVFDIEHYIYPVGDDECGGIQFEFSGNEMEIVCDNNGNVINE